MAEVSLKAWWEGRAIPCARFCFNLWRRERSDAPYLKNSFGCLGKHGSVDGPADARGFGVVANAEGHFAQFGQGLHGLSELQPHFGAAKAHGVFQRNWGYSSSCLHEDTVVIFASVLNRE